MQLASVVIPVYYNHDALPQLHARLSKAAEATPEVEYEFVFVDDGSGDQSFNCLREIAAGDPRVQLIKLSRNFGSNNAVLAGLTYATGNCVAIISADLQDPPELIAEMVARWQKGSKVVLAVRQDRKDPPLAKIPANLFNWLFKHFVLSDFPDRGFDFVLIDRDLVEILTQCREKNTNLMALIMWLGYQRETIQYVREKRPFGKSRWTFAKRLKYFADSFVGFSYLPLRVASLLGFAIAICGFLYAALVLFSKLAWHTEIEGWSSLMVVVLLSSGVQMVMIGVLGEYVWRNLDEARRRPPFVVELRINPRSRS